MFPALYKIGLLQVVLLLVEHFLTENVFSSCNQLVFLISPDSFKTLLLKSVAVSA